MAVVVQSQGLTRGVNRRCRSGALGGDENSRMIAGEVAHRGNVRVERLVRPLGKDIFYMFLEELVLVADPRKNRRDKMELSNTPI